MRDWVAIPEKQEEKGDPRVSYRKKRRRGG